MEIVQERLEREFDLDLITTAPSVVYTVYTTSHNTVRVENPAKLPPQQEIDRIEEPIVKVAIHVPADYVGPVLALCQERRGIQQGIQYASKLGYIYYTATATGRKRLGGLLKQWSDVVQAVKEAVGERSHAAIAL